MEWPSHHESRLQMRVPRPNSRVLLATLAGVVVVLAIVGVIVLTAGGGNSTKEQISPSGGAKALPEVSLHVSGMHHGKASYRKHLGFKVANGTLTSIKIHQAGLGKVPGKLNKTNNRWRSASKLAPSARIKAKVTYADLAGKSATKRFHLRTKAAKHTFNDYLSPAGGTVGIGSPVVVNFDRFVPEKKRAAVEAGLSVQTKPSVIGAWHWVSGESVHWRPPQYWKTGTKVSVTSNLQGVHIAKGVYGPVGTHRVNFTIGAAHISEADQATHQMKIYDNGKLIKTFPISTGRAQYPTMDGVHIALDRNPVIEMNSATVGIPKGNPDYYDETVYWDVRISNGGEFVHAAPWSVSSQGFTNVSHGCVNVSTTNAEWFYRWSQLGDVVDVFGGVRPPEAGDAGTADWNMSWKKWLAGDAAPTKAAQALHPRLPRSYEPGFTPAAKAKAKAKAQHKAHANHKTNAKKPNAKHSKKN